MSERKRKPFNWGSAIGWVIFLLVMAGGPLLRMLQNALGGSIRIADLLPYIVGGLVLLSFAASAVKALGRRASSLGSPGLPERIGPGDSRMPDRVGPFMPTSSPMPPFGGESGLPQLPPLMDPQRGATPATPRGDSYRTPQFEPLFSPALIGLGLIGFLVLGGAALVIFGGVVP